MEPVAYPEHEVSMREHTSDRGIMDAEAKTPTRRVKTILAECMKFSDDVTVMCYIPLFENEEVKLYSFCNSTSSLDRNTSRSAVQCWSVQRRGCSQRTVDRDCSWFCPESLYPHVPKVCGAGSVALIVRDIWIEVVP